MNEFENENYNTKTNKDLIKYLYKGLNKILNLEIKF